MKIKNIYISSLLLVASLVGTTGCNDFWKETYREVLTRDKRLVPIMWTIW